MTMKQLYETQERICTLVKLVPVVLPCGMEPRGRGDGGLSRCQLEPCGLRWAGTRWQQAQGMGLSAWLGSAVRAGGSAPSRFSVLRAFRNN